MATHRSSFDRLLAPAFGIVALAGLAVAEPATAGDPDAHWSSEFANGRLLDNWVYALTVYNGQLIAGGDFIRAGNLQVNNVAAWSGSDWVSLEGGVQHEACPGIPCWRIVYELTTFGDDLIAAGWFIKAGGRPANNIARWDGSHWYPLSLGTNGRIYTLLAHEGVLYVGGKFSDAGGYRVQNIAQWNGISWTGMGTGLEDAVLDLVIHDGKLVAVGTFTYAGNTRVNGIAAWDGETWSPMGEGAKQSATDVVIYNDELIVHGSFPDPENPCCSFSLARWDGLAWVPFLRQPGWSTVLLVYRGDLIAGGSTQMVRWNGETWASLGSGLNDTPLKLVTDGTTLFVGGKFTTAGGKPSQYIARWDDVITPVQIEDFQATVSEHQVILSWRLSQESLREVRAVRVQRSESDVGPYEDVGDALAPSLFMTHVDQEPPQANRVWYRLAVIVGTGVEETTGPLQVVLRERWNEPGRILSARPADDGTSVSVRFLVGRRVPVELVIHDVRGRLLEVLENDVLSPGEHTRTWSRLDRSGRRVPRGIYVLRLDASGRPDTRKVVLVQP